MNISLPYLRQPLFIRAISRFLQRTGLIVTTYKIKRLTERRYDSLLFLLRAGAPDVGRAAPPQVTGDRTDGSAPGLRLVSTPGVARLTVGHFISRGPTSSGLGFRIVNYDQTPDMLPHLIRIYRDLRIRLPHRHGYPGSTSGSSKQSSWKRTRRRQSR